MSDRPEIRLPHLRTTALPRLTRFSGVVALATLLAAASCTGAACGERGELIIVAHFTNPIDSIRKEHCPALLDGRVTDFSQIGGRPGAVRLVADERIAGALAKTHPRLGAVTVRLDEDEALASDRSILGLCDARALRPHFKAVAVDGVLPWGRRGDDYTIDRDAPYLLLLPGTTPWKSKRSFTVVQTGVTAMTRAFIAGVDRSGDVLYPVKETAPITARADLAITSNEVSFLDPCAYPLRDRMRFCSPLRFFEILRHSGFDVIELTGNHNNDFGRKHNTRTLRLLRENGMAYYGGGTSRAEAESVLYLTAGGQRIAFIGFNEVGPPEAWATDTEAGAARLSKPLLEEKLREATAGAPIVFAMVQCTNENEPVPWPSQVRLFHSAIDLGATITGSSSAHRAMGLEFYRGRLIIYGLGNFLFDQMQTVHHRRGMIARHHFHDGRHVQTELIPYIIHDYCRPRLLQGGPARELMDEVFRYSRGPVFD